VTLNFFASFVSSILSDFLFYSFAFNLPMSPNFFVSFISSILSGFLFYAFAFNLPMKSSNWFLLAFIGNFWKPSSYAYFTL